MRVRGLNARRVIVFYLGRVQGNFRPVNAYLVMFDDINFAVNVFFTRRARKDFEDVHDYVATFMFTFNDCYVVMYLLCFFRGDLFTFFRLP